MGADRVGRYGQSEAFGFCSRHSRRLLKCLNQGSEMVQTHSLKDR